MMLITGCARSGTGAITRYLAAEGLDIGHELRLGKDGISSWFLARRDTVPPHGHAEYPATWDRIIHLVRHPLDCIASLSTLSAGSWQWAGFADDLTGHMAYWHQWNSYASARSTERWRIEDRDDHGMGTRYNSRVHGKVTWEQLHEANPWTAARVRTMAEDYGYETR